MPPRRRYLEPVEVLEAHARARPVALQNSFHLASREVDHLAHPRKKVGVLH